MNLDIEHIYNKTFASNPNNESLNQKTVVVEYLNDLLSLDENITNELTIDKIFILQNDKLNLFYCNKVDQSPSMISTFEYTQNNQSNSNV